MAKNIKATEGITITDLVAEMLKSYDAKKAHLDLPSGTFHIVVSAILERANIDTCLSRDQAEYAKRAIFGYPLDRYNGKKDIGEFVDYLSSYINSCRLECGNCINRHCEARDPEF